MRLHPLVEDVLQTGQIRFPKEAPIQANSYIPRDECGLIYRCAALTGALRAVEVGMAIGVSALCLCIVGVHAVALRKRGPDRRRFDHFERF